MAKFKIVGGKKLSGRTELQGSKNSAIPLLAAAVLTKGENVFYGCPRLSDVDCTLRILRCLGCRTKLEGSTALVDSSDLRCSEIPETLMQEMRGSIVFLGAILARCGCARLSLPGGCELGPRPIDLHLKALRKLGAHIKERHGVLECDAGSGLRGARVDLSFPSVGATENLILAAVTAEGTTVITNAAQEPEIVDLCDFLGDAGAKIYGAGESTIAIDGVSVLSAAAHTIIPDRIVAATLMSAAAVTGSELELSGVVGGHLSAVIPVFEEMGCKLQINEGILRIKAPDRLSAAGTVLTMPYPGFPTDAQAPLMAAASVADGTSVFVENIFENRFRHADGLCRLGADINVRGKVAVVSGVKRLYGARVEAQDLRGAAGLVTAALAAEGDCEVDGIRYLDRGYEDFENVLCSLGAQVLRI